MHKPIFHREIIERMVMSNFDNYSNFSDFEDDYSSNTVEKNVQCKYCNTSYTHAPTNCKNCGANQFKKTELKKIEVAQPLPKVSKLSFSEKLFTFLFAFSTIYIFRKKL